MSSHTRKICFQKSKSFKGNDEKSGRMNLTPRNPSKPQFLRTLFAPARQSCKSSLSTGRDKHQKSTPLRTTMKLSVQPEKETKNKYENKADDDFRLSLQQCSRLNIIV